MAPAEQKSKGAGKKNKPITVAKECSMKMKISMCYLQDCAIPDRVKIIRYGDCEEHNHTLEELDRFKRNSKLQKLAGQEVKKRYRARDIKAAIKSNNDPTASTELEAAGGQFFNIFEVHNAGKKWKM